MEIESSRKLETFGKLNCGDLFRFNSSERIYMKIVMIHNSNIGSFNCVDIERGGDYNLLKDSHSIIVVAGRFVEAA